MEKFLETYKLSRVNHEGIESLNRPITSKVSKSVIKNLPVKKTPGPDSFTSEFCQTFKEELTLILKLCQKNRKGGNTSKLIL